MYEITLWILLAFSVGGNARGHVTVIDHFKTVQACEKALTNIERPVYTKGETFQFDRNTNYKCAEATVLRDLPLKNN